MTTINLGYFSKPKPQTEKDAHDIANFALFQLDRIKYMADQNDPSKTEQMLSGLDEIKELFPEPFKIYDFASVDRGDGIFNLVKGDAYVWFDYRKEYGHLGVTNE